MASAQSGGYRASQILGSVQQLKNFKMDLKIKLILLNTVLDHEGYESVSKTPNVGSSPTRTTNINMEYYNER
jgi:hypothetical protein